MRNTINKSDLLQGIRLAAMSSADRGEARMASMLAYLIGWIGHEHPDVAEALADAAGLQYWPEPKRPT
ncbi:hypothetical protein [Burkholderia gladioli]|uniref:hypothetical protein n=1 Tax=Burkholderia gladioli TaxID=28095 RepID=UPI000F521F5F|nr:hypothetical protein [Burkholderia gladioli]